MLVHGSRRATAIASITPHAWRVWARRYSIGLPPPRSPAANSISHSRRGPPCAALVFPLRSRLRWLSLALLTLLRGLDRRTGPADFGSELLELLGRHVGRVLRPRIGARPHVGHVARVDVLDDRDQVRVDLGMTGSMLFVEMEQVRTDDVDAVSLVAGSQADHRHRKRFGQELANLFGCDLAHD